ncbi:MULTISPECIES: hypothetical protein [Actinosynnema]|uniref:hypothetical protein n=1 Tax=Actinosynnema TaxID=40566 RepID=UPI0020A2550D|nr:hypothetical protein [Actinosynnema pretiosum]MCP2094705.1 hypothetical protein [Actinosynnema pretiosum]
MRPPTTTAPLGRVLVVLASSLLVLLANGAHLASAEPGDPPQVARRLATTPGEQPPPSSPPCSGLGCIPQPSTTAPPTTPGATPPGEDAPDEDECGITDIAACVTGAINSFFRGLVTEALNPLLDLLSTSLLTTPMPDSLPRVGELWNNSWQILLLCYGLLVVVAGVLVMGYQSIQTRYSIKEFAPRLVLGFFAGALSLWVGTQGIAVANALVGAIIGDGVDADSAGEMLRNLVLGSFNGPLWVVFTGIFFAGMLVAVLATYVVRVLLTIVLLAGAPLALMLHATPQTEGVAYWWWRAYAGCLAIQLGQSLTLITAIKVFLAPGGFTLLAPTMTGLVNLLVALGLMYVLFKIPFWVLASLFGGGRGLVGSLTRAVVAYKTFGLLTRKGGKGATPRPAASRKSSVRSGPPDPYAAARTTADGQYVLPLQGLRRTRATTRRSPAAAAKPSPAQGRQLVLPLGSDWPENKPVLGRDGQYRLPFDVQRVPPVKSVPGTPPDATPSQRKRRVGRQLPLPFDPYQGNRPDRSGQYPLPFDGLVKAKRPAAPQPPPTPTPPRARRAVQPELPFDPYKNNRPGRDGQYPLPLDGLQKAPAPRPAPAPPAPAGRRAAPPPGRQQRLPLDLPKPPAPPPPPSRPKPRGRS